MATDAEVASEQISDKESTKTDKLVNRSAGVLLAAFIALVLVPLVIPMLGYDLDESYWNRRGTFGDYFGGLFNAAALLILALSFYYQKKELALQRKELALQRIEFKRSVEVFEAQKQEMAAQTAIITNTEIARQRHILFDQSKGPAGQHVREYAMESLLDMGVRKFSNVDLSQLELPGYDLTDCDFSNTNLQFCKINKGILINANLTGVNLDVAQLIGADLRGANLKNTDLLKADLTDANLAGLDLTSTKLGISSDDPRSLIPGTVGANLRGANLSDTILAGSALGLVDLSYANLRGADLDQVNISDASVEGAQIDLKWRGIISGYYGNPLWYDASGTKFTEDDLTKT